MKVVKCDKSHFYDADKYSACPHCRTSTGVLYHEPVEYLTDNDTTTESNYCKALEGFESCKDIREPFIFISYAHEDAEKVKPYFQILEENNFRYWYDDGLPSGKDFYDQICRNIKCAVQFLVFLSKSAQKSENVKDEIHVAYKHKKNMLVVYIEDFELDDGLELALDRKQNLCAYKFSSVELEKRFYNEVSKDALKKCVAEECEEFSEANKSIEDELSSRYTNIKLLTKSRMSEIYLAENINTRTKVIIKKIIFGGTHNKELFYNCYKNERKALESCRCPFMPQIYDSFECDKCAYIIETYIHGETLTEVGAYNEDFIIDLGIKIAHILKYFYYCGIVHCDIKPNNIIVNELGDVFLIDLGSSMFVFDDTESDISTGTVGFAAPEQLDKKGKIDYRTDIYGLGKTMLTLLVGDKVSSQNVFNESTIGLENVSVTCALSIPDIKPQYITESLDYYDKNANVLLTRIINKMISPQKENRYFSLDTLIADLESCKKLTKLP